MTGGHAGRRGRIGGAADGATLRRRLGLVGIEQLLAAEADRLFLWLPVAFCAGIALYFQLLHEPRLGVLAVLPALAFALLWTRPSGLSFYMAAGLLAVALGLSTAKLRTELVRAPVLSERTGAVTVSGRVETAAREEDGSLRLMIRPATIEDLAEAQTPARISVRSRIRDVEVAPGDMVSLRAVLYPPPGPSHPTGFDYARRAWFERIGGVGYAVSAAERIEGAPDTFGGRLAAGIERLRSTMSARIRSHLEGRTGAIAAALITGQRAAVPEETNQALRDSGLYHVISISGLHMVLVVGTIFWSLRAGLALFPGLALTRPIKKYAALAALAGATGYLVLSGAEVATERAYVMAAIMLVAVLLDRPALTLRNVGVAALVVMALSPEAVIGASFQMSFAATLALIAAYEGYSRRAPAHDKGIIAAALGAAALYMGGLMLTSLIAGSATAPFAAFHFNHVSVYGLVANMAAMPLVGTLVMPGALAAALLMPFGLEGPALAIMGIGIEGMVAVGREVASWPGAVRVTPSFSGLALGSIVCGGLWLLLWRTRWRVLGLAGIAAGIGLAALATPPDLFVSRDGRMAALKGDHGRLVFLPRARSSYTAKRWLGATGDERGPGDDTLTEGASCDRLACIAASSRLSVAYIRHPAAFAEECVLSDVVVSEMAIPRWCADTALVLGRDLLEQTGAASVTRSGEGALQLDTAERHTGGRPWSSTGRNKADNG